MYNMQEYEVMLAAKGFSRVAGVDEAGRGPLAGPVVSAAVILPPDFDLPGLNDSKKLSEKKREALLPLIEEQSLAVGVGIVSPARIDEINILRASLESMVKACDALPVQPDYLLIDGKFTLDMPLPQKALVKGDSRSASIAAASIVAKVTRDLIMKALDEEYPGYGLAGHKGYPTKAHKEAIARLGVSCVHRKSFRGVAEHL